MKKWIAGLLCLALALSLWGCGETTPPTTTGATTTEETTPRYRVGVCLPNLSEEYWLQCSTLLQSALEEQGCQVVLEDGQDDPEQQARQVTMLLEEPVDALVVAAVDPIFLVSSLSQAQVPVIAFDRLLINTDKVTAYVAFDHMTVGTQVAQHLVQEKALDTARAQRRKYTIEFFMGDSRNHNSLLFYQGVMQVLGEYLESGVLKSPSGRTEFEDVCTVDTSRELAQKRLDGIKEKLPDILLCGEDTVADGCEDSLMAAELPVEKWPLMTGQGAQKEAAGRILSGQQLLTVYRPASVLAKGCAETVGKVLLGEEVGQTAVQNGMTEVPAVLYMPEIVQKDNLQNLLIDSGIYQAEDFG